MSLIALSGITKTYQMGAVAVRALAGIDLNIEAGERLAIVGPSGSGKSTLMNIIGLLDRPTAGSYRLDGEDVSRLGEGRLAYLRGRRIGFVFQSFNLLPRISAQENVELGLIYAGCAERRQRARRALELVGLGERCSHRPAELSGGEQQRVAIARALAKEPALILADEPTGNLDSRSAGEIIALFERLHAELGLTLIIVTHNPDIARRADRIIALRDGAIVNDGRPAHDELRT
jgi:putative ABC transport system ATP-binding protein